MSINRGARRKASRCASGLLCWVLWGLLVALGGCATQTVDQSRSGNNAPRPQPTVSRSADQALTQLIAESRAQVASRDWQAAIATAERGLRIERREPELYLLLALGYQGLAENARAVQFARQGLRYAPDPASRVAGSLNQLLLALDPRQ